MSVLSRFLLVAALFGGCKKDPIEEVPYRYHPAGWADPAEHGLAAKLETLPCVACHGEDLAGGTAEVGCDACHSAGWRTDCTFCHGGTSNGTGAPPRDIDGKNGALSFPEHTAHVEAGSHAAFACAQCHVTPDDVLSAGHVFLDDDSAGFAEVAFAGGLSAAGAYSGGTCSNLYCHGDGAGQLGTVSSGDPTDCGSCHGAAGASGSLSPIHPSHLAGGVACGECHPATATGSDTISGPEEHVDGEVDVRFPEGFVQDGDTCSGTCHGVTHLGAQLGAFHGEGWALPAEHGPAASLQVQACTICHGSDLTGGTAQRSCDDCHTAGWRTDCTYCHGGLENSTGAPPEDIEGPLAPVSFPEHTAHVEVGDTHVAWECSECHAQPTDVLSAGHVFVADVTAGSAELDFASGVAAGGAYAGGSCTVYCHGDGAGQQAAIASGDAAGCGSCHGLTANPTALSAVHGAHVADESITCAECHATVDASEAIVAVDQHVDGEIDVDLPAGIGFDGQSCTGTCHGVEHRAATWSVGGFHVAGWDAREVHGAAANLQDWDCAACHGADFAGGTSGVSCDDCHAAGWQTDCTYCHGGVENQTGAPPEGIDPDPSATFFAGHSAHVEAQDHTAWDCTLCHAKPADIFTAGHVFVGDDSPGVVEVEFAGLASGATFDGFGCANLYCHGDGAGTVGAVALDAVVGCGSCHGDAASAAALSAVHGGHVSGGATCGECHGATVTGDDTFTGPEAHVNGAVDVLFAEGVVYDGEACTGSCHGIVHDGSTWVGGDFHPATYGDAAEHGLAAKLLEQDCTVCHGGDLDGGSSGGSCDECHTAGWRTDCTYCHGGTDNLTGAPPVDIDGSAVDITFPEHTAHVDGTALHVEWGCDQCHALPTDVLSDGHLFIGDGTPGIAEVDFGGGLASAGVYDGAGSCSGQYCHGNGSGALGDVASGDALVCNSCHGTQLNPTVLSGRHNDHLKIEDGDPPIATCAGCHSLTATGNDVTGTAYHVNGTVDVAPTSVTWNGTGCSGFCHGQQHDPTESWYSQ